MDFPWCPRAFFLFYDLFLAVWDLCVFSLIVASRGSSLVVGHGFLITAASLVAKQGLWGAWALGVVISGPSIAQYCVLEHRLKLWCLVASQPAGSSCIRDQTHVSCIGRWTLHHWATREAPWKHSSRFICKRHSQMCWNKIWFVWASSLCLLSFCCVTDYLL